MYFLKLFIFFHFLSQLFVCFVQFVLHFVFVGQKLVVFKLDLDKLVRLAMLLHFLEWAEFFLYLIKFALGIIQLIFDFLLLLLITCSNSVHFLLLKTKFITKFLFFLIKYVIMLLNSFIQLFILILQLFNKLFLFFPQLL
jgi:hypothetical protein